jgi:pyruvate dehydrogenase E1 component
MFGFQRIGDLIWAAGDARTRGFMLGGTAGRTTLAGEGLQHQDGHTHLFAMGYPNCVAYDPAFAYEIAVIIEDGIRRMYVDQESIFYYLTVMNEHRRVPADARSAKDGILKGLCASASCRQGEAARAKRQRGDPAGVIRRRDPGQNAASAPTVERLRATASSIAKRAPPSDGTCCIGRHAPQA